MTLLAVVSMLTGVAWMHAPAMFSPEPVWGYLYVIGLGWWTLGLIGVSLRGDGWGAK